MSYKRGFTDYRQIQGNDHLHCSGVRAVISHEYPLLPTPAACRARPHRRGRRFDRARRRDRRVGVDRLKDRGERRTQARGVAFFLHLLGDFEHQVTFAGSAA